MEVVIVVLLLLMSAFFSASELAIMSIPLYKIKQNLNNWKNKLASILWSLRQNPEKTLITILIWNNFVNVFLSIYAWQLGTNIAKHSQILSQIGLSWALLMTVISIVITFMILMFWEILPKVFATKFALKFWLIVAPIIKTLMYLLYPIVLILEFIVKLFNKLFSSDEEKVSKEDIEIFIEDWKKQWIFSDMESMIIKNFLEFNDRGVESVLKHRTEVVAIPSDYTLKEAIEVFLKYPYSRLPVFEWDKDNIIWILTIRDALQWSQNEDNLNKKLKELPLKWVFRVPVTANIFDVFMQMKKKWKHFAVVIDEYWGTAWIVTFEDILEDMVWDIKDESDILEEREIVKIDENSVVVKWDVVLRDVLRELDYTNFELSEQQKMEFTEEDMISYIILSLLKSFAKKGDKVRLDGLEMEVLDVNPKKNKILKVKVTKLV